MIDARKKEGPFYLDDYDNTKNLKFQTKSFKNEWQYYGEVDKHGNPIGKGIHYSCNEQKLDEGIIACTTRIIRKSNQIYCVTVDDYQTKRLCLKSDDFIFFG